MASIVLRSSDQNEELELSESDPGGVGDQQLLPQIRHKVALPKSIAEIVQIPREEIKFGRKLGEGTYGTVYTTQWSGKEYAAKTFRDYASNEKIMTEAKTLAVLKHDNIVQLIGVAIGSDKNDIVMVMEYVEDGSVEDVLVREEGDLLPQDIVQIALDVAEGLHFLHSQKIIHRDLKSGNVLLYGGKKRAKIADFGTVRIFGHSSRTNSFQGTMTFMAPEIMHGKSYDAKADVYSYGALLYHMITKRFFPILFESDEAAETMIKATVEDATLQDLIIKCAKKNPDDRPTIEDCMKRLRPFEKNPPSTAIQTSSDSEEHINVINAQKNATDLYDVGINIDSLLGFANGWNIYGKYGASFPERNGRVIGVLGEFKSGKTWFLSRLLRLSGVENIVVDTPGLGVMCSEKEELDNQHNLGNLLPYKRLTEENYIFLDSAGWDAPINGDLLEDAIATEYYVRELVLSMSSAVMFLCNEYNRSTQTTVNSLINQINSLSPSRQRITRENRLFVIHNHIDSPSIEYPTQELVNLYDDGELRADIRDAKANVMFWQTDKVTHVFLGNDSKCREYNDIVFEMLRNEFRKYNITANFSLLDKVIEFTKLNLMRYVEDMNDPQIEIYSDETSSCLRPILARGGEQIHPLKLRKLRFLGGEQYSESYQELKVTVSITNEGNKSYYVFKAETPGLESVNNVKYQFRGLRTLKMVVQTSDHALTAEEIIVLNVRQDSERIFIWKTPKDSPFAVPKILDQKLQNGILQFRIERTRPEAIEVWGHEIEK